MKKSIQQGSIFGGTLLIAGSCVGAGILGLVNLKGNAIIYKYEVDWLIIKKAIAVLLSKTI